MVLKQIVTIIAFAIMSCAVARAQVEKAVVETSGMRSCAVCNMALEVALARIPGAARVAIDGPTQTFTVFYKPNQHFNPKDLRDAAARARLEVTTIRVTTCGTVQDRDGYKYLASGQDRFALLGKTELPQDEHVRVVGTVDESADSYRMQLKVEAFKRVRPVTE